MKIFYWFYEIVLLLFMAQFFISVSVLFGEGIHHALLSLACINEFAFKALL